MALHPESTPRHPPDSNKDFQSFDITLDRNAALASSPILPTEKIEVRPEEFEDMLNETLRMNNFGRHEIVPPSGSAVTSISRTITVSFGFNSASPHSAAGLSKVKRRYSGRR